MTEQGERLQSCENLREGDDSARLHHSSACPAKVLLGLKLGLPVAHGRL
jgi:hypothetical protein